MLRPVFRVVVVRSQNFLQHGESRSPPLLFRFDRVCCDVIKHHIACFFHQGVVCNMSEGTGDRLMDQNGDQGLDLKRSGRVGEDEGQIQAAKRRKTAANEQTQDQKQDLDQDQDGESRKFPKKKVALLMAYSGKGYYGMQVQTGSTSSASGVPVRECDHFVCLCARGTLGAPSSGPSKTTWSVPSSSLAASLRTMART